jgi:hypothetical protein
VPDHRVDFPVALARSPFCTRRSFSDASLAGVGGPVILPVEGPQSLRIPPDRRGGRRRVS